MPVFTDDDLTTNDVSEAVTTPDGFENGTIIPTSTEPQSIVDEPSYGQSIEQHKDLIVGVTVPIILVVLIAIPIGCAIIIIILYRKKKEKR